MDYSELIFTSDSEDGWQQDLLINDLAEIGFDTFEETSSGFKAYIASATLDLAEVERILLKLPESFSVSYVVNKIEPQNWNAVWESNFEPIYISDKCYVRATFHEQKPNYEYEIIIDPKMAFGTGHHQTTSLMMTYLLDTNLDGKRVLDMGCGTGILAILAAKIGASEITAIDYDPICYASVKENIELNQVSNIKALCGSKEAIPDEIYDVILANINRNILLDHLRRYAESLKPNGLLFLSGFYDGNDLEQIIAVSETIGLIYKDKKTQNNWVAAKFERNNSKI
ncbi:50S ribosomal protein L11 methyltransferase [Olivibacter domesticus]|nr:50S ribosomal protein L11 methyltransferase [Olivibacter domesticus]